MSTLLRPAWWRELILVVLMMAGLHQPCDAHFLYVGTDKVDGQECGVLYFSESAQIAGSHLPKRIATANAWWRNRAGVRQPLELKPAGEGRPGLQVTEWPQDSVGSFEAACEYGVYQSSFLLRYHTKYLKFDRAEDLPAINRTPEFHLDVAIKYDGRHIIATTFVGEQPIGSAKLAWTDPSGKTTESITDELGQATFQPVGAGLYSLRAHYVDASAAGEHNGDAYQQLHEYTTVTFNQAATEHDVISLPQLPEPISSFGAVVHDDWLYIYGGHTGKEHEHSRDNLSTRHVRCSLSSSSATSWEELPMETAVQGLALVADKEGVIRVGGLTARNAAGAAEDLHSIAEVARYQPTQQAWVKLASLPSPRSSHDAAVLAGRIYVVGGWQLSGEPEGTWLSEMHSLDPNDPAAEWIRHPQPFERRALTAAAFDGKLYVIGGMDADHKISRSVEIWDPQTQAWSTGPELPGEGMNGFGVSAWTLNDVLFASGSNGTVYRLEAGDLHWHEHLKLAQPRFFHRLLPASPCGLLAVGGASLKKEAHLDGSEFIPYLVPNAANDAGDGHDSK